MIWSQGHLQTLAPNFQGNRHSWMIDEVGYVLGHKEKQIQKMPKNLNYTGTFLAYLRIEHQLQRWSHISQYAQKLTTLILNKADLRKKTNGNNTFSAQTIKENLIKISQMKLKHCTEINLQLSMYLLEENLILEPVTHHPCRRGQEREVQKRKKKMKWGPKWIERK